MTIGRTCLLAGSAVWLLLGTGGCGSANPNLFENGLAAQPAGGSNAGNTSETGSAGMDLNTSGGSGDSVAGSPGYQSGGSGGSGAGCAFSCGDGGRGGSGGLGGGGAAGVSAQAGSGSELTDCTGFSPDAKFLPATQHCYLVDNEERTFAAAQAHCKTLDAHLVTLNSEAENDFAWSIHADEHWIGSKDGKTTKQPGVGTYTWLTDEPFDYTNWSQDQPNASATECGDSNGGGTCYEHCAFQWKGGERDGQWNDRYCLHTIASICEWDSAP